MILSADAEITGRPNPNCSVSSDLITLSDPDPSISIWLRVFYFKGAVLASAASG